MTIRSIISVLLVVTVVMASDVAFADNQSIQLDLPREPLANALVHLGEKCGYSIIFEKKITDGLSSAALDGDCVGGNGHGPGVTAWAGKFYEIARERAGGNAGKHVALEERACR